VNAFLLGVFPYVAVTVALAGLIWRLRAARHTITASSSQMMESRLLSWASVSWHSAILVLLFAHLVAIVLPRAVVTAVSSPVRLVALELAGFALGVTALWSLLALGLRKLLVRGGTSGLDVLVWVLLLVQVATGVFVAATARWGLAWFPHVATPWLASLARLSPRVDLVANLAPAVKVHLLGACVLLAVAPFTRLAHVLAAPIGYLWRSPQIVTWWRPRPAVPTPH
jgi:nitrate reductase gamma subunit